MNTIAETFSHYLMTCVRINNKTFMLNSEGFVRWTINYGETGHPRTLRVSRSTITENMECGANVDFCRHSFLPFGPDLFGKSYVIIRIDRLEENTWEINLTPAQEGANAITPPWEYSLEQA